MISNTHSIAWNAVEATVSSGIRSVFCYTPTLKLQTWKPDMIPDFNILDDWVWRQLDQLGENSPYAEGRVQLGLGFDGLMLPRETVVALFTRARKVGAKVITTHYVRGYFGNSFLFPCPLFFSIM